MPIVTRDPLKQIRMGLDGKRLYVETTSFNDHVLENNQAHRNAGHIPQGTKAKLQPDGAEIVHVIQAPEVDWNRFKRKHHDLYRQLHSPRQFIRESAAMKIKALHPEWFVEVSRPTFKGI